MNNIEEKAIINVKNSYETISLEPNIDEYTNKISNNNIIAQYNQSTPYPTLPLSSEKNTSIENTHSKINQLCQMFIQKFNVAFNMIQIEKSSMMFFGVLTIGVVFIMISLLMLPMFMLTPTKFAFTFGTGSSIIVLSFVFLYGLKEYCQMLCEQNRKWLTFSFFLSILLGLIFAWRRYFFLSLIISIYQMIAVILFTLSFVPGGQNGIVLIKDVVKSFIANAWDSIKSNFKINT